MSRPKGRIFDGPMLRAVLVMLGFQVVSFRLFLFDTGFYYDDWVTLVHVAQGGGLWGAWKAFGSYAHIAARPVEILLFPLLHTLTGIDSRPEIGQGVLLVFDAVESVLFLLVVLRLTQCRRFAFVAASFMSLYPSRAVMHVWLADSPQIVSQILLLSSFLCHLSWVESRRSRALVLGQFCFLAGALCYESILFLPLMLWGGLLGHGRSVRDSLRDTAPYGISMVLVLVWQWALVPVIWGEINTKDIVFSLGHFFKSFGAGFECIANRVLHACALSVGPVLYGFSGAFGALWLLVVGSAAVVVNRSETFLDSARVAPRPAVVLILSTFVGAYLPYALSGTYMPQFFGIMSRTNGAGVWAGGLLLAWLFDGRSRRLQAGLAAAILGVFTLANWHATWEYAQSWKIQQAVLGRITHYAAGVLDPATVILSGVPRHFGRAVVFDATYDLNYALKLRTGRRRFSGQLLGPHARFEPDALVLTDYGDERRYPYTGLYLYDFPTDSFTPLRGPDSPQQR